MEIPEKLYKDCKNWTNNKPEGGSGGVVEPGLLAGDFFDFCDADFVRNWVVADFELDALDSVA